MKKKTARRKTHKSKKILLVSIIVFALLLLTTLFMLFQNTQREENSELARYAEEIIEKCSGKDLHQVCYDEEIPKLLSKLSMEQVFDVTREVQKRDDSYYWCHVLSHKIGETQYVKDPSKWEEIALSCPNDICSNGCLHGVLQKRYRYTQEYTEKELSEIRELFRTLCEERDDWKPTDNQQASCYHGIGHITMYIFNGDLHDSMGMCDEIGIKEDGRNFTRTCYEGSFMQLYQPREPEDIALVEGKAPQKEDLYDFCRQFTGHENAAYESCVLEGWTLFDSEIRSEEGIEKFCSFAQNYRQKRACYTKMFYNNLTFMDFDYKQMKEFCAGMKKGLAAYCFSDTISRMVSTDNSLFDEGVEVCEYARRLNPDDERCLNSLVLNADFVFYDNSAEKMEACRMLPENWFEKCMKGEYSYDNY